MNSMKSAIFAAIDFETADYGRDSACAVAAVVVNGSTIERKLFHLIKPPRRNFVFTYIHGIEWRHVEQKPAFDGIWDDLHDHIGPVDFIAAHNASFDRSVMRACCSMSNIAMPAKRFLCTMKMARKIWAIRPTKLSDVCTQLRLPLQHHDAASDALACANIVLRAMDEGFDPVQFVDQK
jgi:DNA polymerase-3 subunit epsilon